MVRVSQAPSPVAEPIGARSTRGIPAVVTAQRASSCNTVVALKAM